MSLLASASGRQLLCEEGPHSCSDSEELEHRKSKELQNSGYKCSKRKVDGFLMAAQGWAMAAGSELAPYLQKRRNKCQEELILPLPKHKHSIAQKVEPETRKILRGQRPSAREAARKVRVPSETETSQQLLLDPVGVAFQMGCDSELASIVSTKLDHMAAIGLDKSTNTRIRIALPSEPETYRIAPRRTRVKNRMHQDFLVCTSAGMDGEKEMLLTPLACPGMGPSTIASTTAADGVLSPFAQFLLNEHAGENLADMDYAALQDFLGELNFTRDDPAIQLTGTTIDVDSSPHNAFQDTTSAKEEAVINELPNLLPSTVAKATSPGLSGLLSSFDPKHTHAFTSPTLPGLMSPTLLASMLPF